MPDLSVSDLAMDNRDRVARALWKVNCADVSFDEALRACGEDSANGRAHTQALRWVREAADAAIAAQGNEINRLRGYLQQIETATSTADGLSPENTICLNMLAGLALREAAPGDGA